MYDLLGTALVGMRLSYDDFCRLTPEEFGHACKEYRRMQDAAHRDRWSRMRMLAAITIQPHLKKKITPQGLLPFPWEGRGRGGEAGARPEPGRAERLARLARRLKGTLPPSAGQEAQTGAAGASRRQANE